LVYFVSLLCTNNYLGSYLLLNN